MLLLAEIVVRKFQVGDICYLFLSGKGHGQIKFRLEVVDTSCTRNDMKYWMSAFVPDNGCYKMVPKAPEYKGDGLLREALKTIGIKSHTQVMFLNEKQAEYIDGFFGI